MERLRVDIPETLWCAPRLPADVHSQLSAAARQAAHLRLDEG